MLPTLHGYQWMKPYPKQWHRGMADPKWRWFWDTVIFADPLIQGGCTARETGWDYGAWTPADILEANLPMEAGPRGWRRRWSNSVSTDYCFNSGNLTGYRSAWAHAGNLSLFAVSEQVATNDTDVLAIIEGGSGDTTAENSNIYLAQSGSGGSLEYIHESGSGTNRSVTATSYFTDGQRVSTAVVRSTADTTIRFYKDGALHTSGTYAAAPAVSDRQSVSIGDRNGTDIGSPASALIECVYVAKVAWSPAEIHALHRDPWGPFRRSYRQGAAAVGGGYSGVRPQTAWLG